MKLEGFLVGVLAFIALGLVTFVFVTDVYETEKGLNVSLADDPDTAKLGVLQAQLEEHYETNRELNADLWDKTAGEPGANLDEELASDAELAKSAFQGLTNVGLYFNSFFIMLQSFFSALGISSSIVFWFFATALLLTLAILLIRAVLPNV